MNIHERSKMLLGEERFARLSAAKVAVFGLGGVGGTAVEALVRSGIKHLTIVDFDVVAPSNLNRQILFLSKDVGKKKTDAAAERLLAINPDLDIEKIDERIDESFFEKHSFASFDYLIDAVDDVEAKLAIAKYALGTGIRFISCLGMANRVDPSKVAVKTLATTANDPLAKKIRSVFRHQGIDLTKVQVVTSEEIPLFRGPTPSSMMMVPSEAGLLIDSVVILYLANGSQED